MGNIPSSSEVFLSSPPTSRVDPRFAPSHPAFIAPAAAANTNDSPSHNSSSTTAVHAAAADPMAEVRPLTARERQTTIFHRETIGRGNPMSPILLLEGAIFNVMSFLQTAELLSLSATCRSFRDIEQLFHQHLWKTLYIQQTLLDRQTRRELMRSVDDVIDFEDWKQRTIAYENIKWRLLSVVAVEGAGDADEYIDSIQYRHPRDRHGEGGGSSSSSSSLTDGDEEDRTRWKREQYILNQLELMKQEMMDENEEEEGEEEEEEKKNGDEENDAGNSKSQENEYHDGKDHLFGEDNIVGSGFGDDETCERDLNEPIDSEGSLLQMEKQQQQKQMDKELKGDNRSSSSSSSDWNMSDDVDDTDDKIKNCDNQIEEEKENMSDEDDDDSWNLSEENEDTKINGVQEKRQIDKGTLLHFNKDSDKDSDDYWGLDDDSDDDKKVNMEKTLHNHSDEDNVPQLSLRRLLPHKRRPSSSGMSSESASLITPGMIKKKTARPIGHHRPAGLAVAGSADEDILLGTYMSSKPSTLFHEIICLLCDEQAIADRYFSTSVVETRRFYDTFLELDKQMQFPKQLPKFEEHDWPTSFHNKYVGHGIKVYFCLLEASSSSNPLQACSPVAHTFTNDSNPDDLSKMELCPGLIVGPWLLCWSARNKNSLVIPQNLLGNAMHIRGKFHRLAELRHQSLDQLSYSLAKTVCRWNNTKRHDPLSCNGMHFVDSILNTLGISVSMQRNWLLTSGGHAFDNTIDTLRYTGSVGLQFEVSEEDSFYSHIVKSWKSKQQHCHKNTVTTRSGDWNISKNIFSGHDRILSSSKYGANGRYEDHGTGNRPDGERTPPTPVSAPIGRGTRSSWGSYRKRNSSGHTSSNPITISPTSAPPSVPLNLSVSDRSFNFCIRITSHAELDLLITELLKQDSEYSIHHHLDYSLLLLFDRILWEKWALFPVNDLLCPQRDGLLSNPDRLLSPRSKGIREIVSSAGYGCPFGSHN